MWLLVVFIQFTCVAILIDSHLAHELTLVFVIALGRDVLLAIAQWCEGGVGVADISIKLVLVISSNASFWQ